MHVRFGSRQHARSFPIGGLSAALLGLLLSGCQSRLPPQDSFHVRPSSAATMMPDATMQRQYHPPTDGTPDSPVAYQPTPTPSYADRPLSDNLQGSSEAADYVAAIRAAGLLPVVAAAGPYTVFAIPNLPLERYSEFWPGGLMAPANRGTLHHLLQYTIVPGCWTEAVLRKKIARNRGRGIRLTTLSREILEVQDDPGTHELVLSNAHGQSTRLWLVSVPQSNGVLYFTQGVLAPAVLRTPDMVSSARSALPAR